MSIRDARRQAVLERMADHILSVGLRGASLRPLAAAAGTTNRMLLYYFADKDELLEATLRQIADRLMRLLDGSVGEPVPFEVLLPGVWAAVRSPEMKPYTQLWLELAAMSARDEEPFRAIAGQIFDGFLAWAAARLKVEDESDRPRQAALLLGTVEGLVLLDAVGRGTTAETALTSRPAP